MTAFIHISNLYSYFNGLSCVHVSSHYPLSNLRSDDGLAFFEDGTGMILKCALSVYRGQPVKSLAFKCIMAYLREAWLDCK